MFVLVDVVSKVGVNKVDHNMVDHNMVEIKMIDVKQDRCLLPRPKKRYIKKVSRAAFFSFYLNFLRRNSLPAVEVDAADAAQRLALQLR